MKRTLLGFCVICLAALPLYAQDNGNPPNWCRNGHFSAYRDFLPARVNGKPTERAYFFRDDGDCPAQGACQKKSYVLGGNELLAAKSYGAYTCVWFQSAQGPETVGWVLTERLALREPNPAPALKDWLGTWKYYDNFITIRRQKGRAGFLHFSGEAFWRGFGDSIHTGEIDAIGQPQGNLFTSVAQEEYDCSFTLRLVGRYLIAKDNFSCGGVNVTFAGVYVK